MGDRSTTEHRIDGSVLRDQKLSNAKHTRAGVVTVTAVETTKGVTFTAAMPSNNYRVTLQPLFNLALSDVWPTNLTVSGFTLNIQPGNSGSIDYMAIEN